MVMRTAPHSRQGGASTPERAPGSTGLPPTVRMSGSHAEQGGSSTSGR